MLHIVEYPGKNIPKTVFFVLEYDKNKDMNS